MHCICPGDCRVEKPLENNRPLGAIRSSGLPGELADGRAIRPVGGGEVYVARQAGGVETVVSVPVGGCVTAAAEAGEVCGVVVVAVEVLVVV